MDLAISDGATQGFSNLGVQQPVAQIQPVSRQAHQGMVNGSEYTELDILQPQEAFSGILQHGVSLLLSSYRRNRSNERNPNYNTPSTQTTTPTPGMINLLKLCWRITNQSDLLLTVLLTTAIGQVVGQPPNLDGRDVDGFITLVEELPVALRWWRDEMDPLIPYPVSLRQ